MKNKNLTAVEWIEERLTLSFGDEIKDLRGFFVIAKQMEKKQIKDAFVECWKANVPDGIECKLDAEQYYTETYEE